jgi:hypothetical protein
MVADESMALLDGVRKAIEEGDGDFLGDSPSAFFASQNNCTA